MSRTVAELGFGALRCPGGQLAPEGRRSHSQVLLQLFDQLRDGGAVRVDVDQTEAVFGRDARGQGTPALGGQRCGGARGHAAGDGVLRRWAGCSARRLRSIGHSSCCYLSVCRPTRPVDAPGGRRQNQIGVGQLRADPDLAGEEFLARRLGQLRVGAPGAEGEDVEPAQGFGIAQDLDVPGNGRVRRVEDEVFTVA